mgnify:CR=1 FL=1
MMVDAIKARRSIRHFLPTELSKEQVEEILSAGSMAPSAKNLQPWHFVVTTGAAKERVCKAMQAGIERERHSPMLPDTRHYLDGASETLRVMREAAAVILITVPSALPMGTAMSLDQRITEICTAQSVGAAIQNMCLQATALGLGSLWICDSFFAQAELRAEAGGSDEVYALLALGHAAEKPAARPRRPLEKSAEWRTE